MCQEKWDSILYIFQCESERLKTIEKDFLN